MIFMLPASSIVDPNTADGKFPLLIDRVCGDPAAMKDLRVEITDEGSALYVAVDADGQWAKTTQPDDLITIDWDGQGRVIGIEAIGSAARSAIEALVKALVDYPAREPGRVHEALNSVAGSSLLERMTPAGSSR
jgi:YD repeat-containing protein